ncbi:plastocyanin/azurin family copper-binding protein [Apibacter sp. HY039]|uniref:plastocyanin/azurin family copper-binding protein n=1 Tax=Apibacter sp. HY039 TaxID=2501476 RepID=UPI000FEBBDC9|nr:azurin [Apibacter sp. HY039]
MKKITKILSLLALGLSMTIISCNKNSENSGKSDPLAIAANTTAEDIQKSKEERRANLPENVLEIEGADNMQYDITELKAKAGKPITLKLTHVGKASKADMGHNLVILKSGTDIDAFGREALKFASNDYIPTDTSKIIAHTKLLGGGQSDTITFTINEKGTYDFLCTFPGHHVLMRGKLIVD